MLESFDELYKKYGPMVLRRCRFILQDEDKALDAMQDTFVRIFERKEYLQEVCASFFYTAATRVCLNRIRSDKVRYASRLDDILQGVADSRSEAGAETQFEERITSSAFLDFLFSSENEKTKEMAVLHYVDGFTLEETAEKTHFSVSGVRKRLREFAEAGGRINPFMDCIFSYREFFMANTDLELEQLKLGEIDKDFWFKKHQCSEAELEKMLANLRSSDEEILSAYPAENMKTAILEKMQPEKSKFVFKMPSAVFGKIKPFAAVAAAVLFCAVLIPFQIVQNKNTSAVSENAQIRVKGASNPSLFLYKNENGKAVKLSDHEKIGGGEIIQISYIAGKAAEGMIFSIDGNGVLTQHFPEKKAVSGTLVQGKEVALDFSYKLDNAPRFEKFYFVTGDEPFTSSDLEISIRTGSVSSSGKNKLSVTEFYLEK